jgi:ankyrin repeat protein
MLYGTITFQKNKQKMIKLIKKKEDLNLIDFSNGRSRLFDAIILKDKRGILCLLDNGANVNNQDKNGWTPLHLLAYFGDVEITKIILGYNPDLTLTTKNHGKITALQMAVIMESREIAELIAEAIRQKEGKIKKRNKRSNLFNKIFRISNK